MSFRCDGCNRPQEKMWNPDRDRLIPARPIPVVVERYEDGQIKVESKLCQSCAKSATPAPLPERRAGVVETMTLAFPDLSDVLGWVN